MSGWWKDVMGSWRTGRRLRQTGTDNCVQTVVAMVLGVPVEQVESAAGTRGRMSVDETTALLSRAGIYCRPVAASLVADFWPMFRKRHGGRHLRGLGFALPKTPGRAGHAFYITGATLYDPATGQTTPLNETTLHLLDWLALLPREAGRRDALSRARAVLQAEEHRRAGPAPGATRAEDDRR